jgi:hypothetical protein
MVYISTMLVLFLDFKRRTYNTGKQQGKSGKPADAKKADDDWINGNLEHKAKGDDKKKGGEEPLKEKNQ